MTREVRYHIDELPEGDLTPKSLSKQEFGRRLYSLMLARGWNQSELARQANLPRDSISNYIRGRSLPTPKSLQMLADGLGMRPADVLPTIIERATSEDDPALEMRVSPAAPNAAWLRVNRLVSLTTASKVIELINQDRIGDKPAHAT